MHLDDTAAHTFEHLKADTSGIHSVSYDIATGTYTARQWFSNFPWFLLALLKLSATNWGISFFEHGTVPHRRHIRTE